MSNFPSVKAKEFIRVVEKLGFYFDRQKGSHAIYKKYSGEKSCCSNSFWKRHQTRYFDGNDSRY